MKIKMIILVLSMLMISCSSDSDDDKGIFSTPSWIQGTWRKNTTDETLTFTKRDIIYNKSYSFGEQSGKFNSMHVQVITNTSSSYIIDYYQEKDMLPIRFTFIKKTNTQMEASGHFSGSYIKQ